jgi:Kef-type K+ transport system membrane component KefB
MNIKKIINYLFHLLVVVGVIVGLGLLLPHYRIGMLLDYFKSGSAGERFILMLFVLLVIVPLLEKFFISGIITLIATGIILGPHALNVIPKEPVVLDFFADIGKIYILFLAGLEVDLNILRQKAFRTFFFGLLTFSLPFAAGFLVGKWFGYSRNASFLIASLLASHTLLSLPVIQKRNLLKVEFASITIGGTVITDILSMLVLAVCLFIHSGQFTTANVLQYVYHLLLFCVVVIGGIFWLGEAYFHRQKDDVLSAVFILMALAIASMTARVIHLESIVGAFLCGLAINGAALSHRVTEKLRFIGNLMFIPAFFVYFGFSLDIPGFWAAFFKYQWMGLALLSALICGKFLAAVPFGTIFRYRFQETLTMWSLTIPQVAATLAAAMVAYDAIGTDGQRLIDTQVLNGVLILVVITCFLGPFLADIYSKKVAKTLGATTETKIAG